MYIYKKFRTPDEVDQWVHSSYSEKELLETDVHYDTTIQPLKQYKGEYCYIMNEYIRKGYADIQKDYDIRGLQNFLQSRTIKDSIEAYRFISLKEWCYLFAKTRCHSELPYPSFLSTTLLKEYFSMEQIKNQSPIAITIRIPKGAAGTYICEANPERPEYEYLLPYYTKIKRISLKTFEVVL